MSVCVCVCVLGGEGERISKAGCCVFNEFVARVRRSKNPLKRH